MTIRPAPSHPTFAETLRVWAAVGVLSFGGSAGQIAAMHRVLVDEKKWVGEPRFLHALNFCMLLPGPEAQQLATYLGWVLHRIPGGIAAGALFVLPGCAVMMGLAALYVGLHQVPVVEGLFFGLKPAVLAVVVDSLLRIGGRTLRHRALAAIAALAFAALFVFHLSFPVIVLGAGALGFLAARAGHPAFQPAVTAGPGGAADAILDAEADHTRPSLARGVAVALVCLALWLAPVAAALAWGQGAFGAIGLFFAKVAVVTFGGAYAVLAYVAQQAVEVHGWLGAGEMLDGLGLAETTPGPLILVNQFVGFLAGFRHPGGLDPWTGAVLAALLTVWATFMPTFLWIFVGAPYVERVRRNRSLAGALSAISAAVVGVILNLSVWFSLHVVFHRVHEPRFGPAVPDWQSVDPLSAGLAVVSMVAMLRFKMGMIPTLAAAATTGMLWRLVAG